MTMRRIARKLRRLADRIDPQRYPAYEGSFETSATVTGLRSSGVKVVYK